MNTAPARVSVSGTTLILAIAAMFIAVVGAVTIISVAVPDSQNPSGLIGLLLGSFATLVVNIGVLFQLSQVKQQVNQTADDTQKVVQQTNGSLDARIRALSYASVRKALTDHLDDPDDPVKPPPF